MTLPRILVIDDEKDNLEALRRLLRKDFEVTVAASAEEVLALLEAPRPPDHEWDVLLSDQRMPGLTGSEFFALALEREPLATRVLLTGFADLEAVIDAVNRGHIWRYVSKPWEPEELLQSLRQAAERSQLRRSLELSRRELERALVELRARDWARERLLQILLHEFRTAPQTLEGLRALDPGGADAESRIKFIDSLATRFGVLESDLRGLLEDERRSAQLPRAPLRLSQVLAEALGPAVPLENGLGDGEPSLLSHAETLRAVLAHLRDLLAHNTAGAPVRARLDATSGSRPLLFVSLLIESPPGSPTPLPRALATQGIEARLAWQVLLEPFVGSGDFMHHSQGLRVETARHIRWLASLGGRAEFQVARESVELVMTFSVA